MYRERKAVRSVALSQDLFKAASGEYEHSLADTFKQEKGVFYTDVPLAEKIIKEDAILIITADHGNDPTTPDTDHNREYVPLLVYGKRIHGGFDLGTRSTFADIAATLAARHQLLWADAGKSFYEEIIIK